MATKKPGRITAKQKSARRRNIKIAQASRKKRKGPPGAKQRTRQLNKERSTWPDWLKH